MVPAFRGDDRFITTGLPPTADFAAPVRAGSVPMAVKFTDQSKGGPTSWSWDFGDGSKSTDRNPTHMYTKAGTYSVTLLVANSYGSDTETKPAYITAGGKPTADFTADERRGVKPFTVTFTDLSTGNPTSWKWDFGDGNSSIEQNPVHTYQQEGAYDVTLTVSNAYGTDTIKKTGMTPVVSQPIATPQPTAPAVSATMPATQAPASAGQATAVPVTPIPGFEGILAITGLAVLVVLAKRR